MSNFQATGGIWAPIRAKLTTSAVTTVVAAGKGTALVNLHVRNLTNSTPTVTVAIYDGTNRYYLAYVVPMTAYGVYEFTMGAALNRLEAVEVSISANSADVTGIYATNSQQ